MPPRPDPTAMIRSQRGASLVELVIALVVLALGILAVGRLFPAGARSQGQDRMLSAANYYAQEKIEELVPCSWSDSRVSLGRHPAGTATDDLGDSGAWHRFYTVEAMPAPLDNLRRVTVTVSWTFLGARSVTATTYLRR